MKLAKHLIIRSFGLTILFFLNGCAICTQMPPQYKQTIHTLTLNRNISVPDKMSYTSSKTQMATCFGGIIGQIAVANSVDVPQRNNLSQVVAQNNIKIDQIVLRQFINQINRNSTYHLVNHGPADAELCVKVTDYGLISPSEFSGGLLKPQLQVSLSLIKNGKEIWTSRDFTTTTTSDMPEYTYEQFMQNPSWIAAVWNAAAERIAYNIVSHM